MAPSLFTAHPLFLALLPTLPADLWDVWPPPRVQFLSFSCSFREKFGQIIGWHLHLGVGIPSIWEILDLPLLSVMLSNNAQCKKLVLCACALFTTYMMFRLEKNRQRLKKVWNETEELFSWILDWTTIKQSTYIWERKKMEQQSLNCLALDSVFHGANFPISVITREVQNISMISHFLNESLSVVREENMEAELTLALLTLLLTQTVRKIHPL